MSRGSTQIPTGLGCIAAGTHLTLVPRSGYSHVPKAHAQRKIFQEKMQNEPQNAPPIHRKRRFSRNSKKHTKRNNSSSPINRSDFNPGFNTNSTNNNNAKFCFLDN